VERNDVRSMQPRAIADVIQQCDHGVDKLTIEQNLLKTPLARITMWKHREQAASR
jgi:hypothetical protein